MIRKRIDTRFALYTRKSIFAIVYDGSSKTIAKIDFRALYKNGVVIFLKIGYSILATYYILYEKRDNKTTDGREAFCRIKRTGGLQWASCLRETKDIRMRRMKS